MPTTACRHVDVLRWLAGHGLEFDTINDHGQGCISKAAWFGHAEAVHWLICAEDGPQLGHHLPLTEHENGLTVEQLTHCAGHFVLGCWLGVLTNIASQQQEQRTQAGRSAQAVRIRECCVGMELPEVLLDGASHELRTTEWLPWREEHLVRLVCEFDRVETKEDAGSSSIHAIESFLVHRDQQLTPVARRWRKSILVAARASGTEEARRPVATTTELADNSPKTPVARALKIVNPDAFAKATSILATA